MLKTYVGRVAVGAVFSAALMAGSLGLTATAAGACTGSAACSGGPPTAAALAASCTDPDCTRGVPPVAASAVECTDPRCVSGTQPATAPRPRSRVTGRTGHGEPPAAAWPRAAARTSTVSAGQINCPPPNPEVTALTRGISDC